MPTEDDDRWGEFFARVPFTYFRSALKQAPYIQAICDYVEKSVAAGSRVRVAEIACGTGYTAALIADLFRPGIGRGEVVVEATDVSEELVRAMGRPFRGLDNLHPRRRDAFDLATEGEYDVIFHQGFLEHFSDEDIKGLVRAQLKSSSYVVLDVPNHRRAEKVREFGNERFLRPAHWRDLFESDGARVVEQRRRRLVISWKRWVPRAVADSPSFLRRFGETSIFVLRPLVEMSAEETLG